VLHKNLHLNNKRLTWLYLAEHGWPYLWGDCVFEVTVRLCIQCQCVLFQRVEMAGRVRASRPLPAGQCIYQHSQWDGYNADIPTNNSLSKTVTLKWYATTRWNTAEVLNKTDLLYIETRFIITQLINLNSHRYCDHHRLASSGMVSSLPTRWRGEQTVLHLFCSPVVSAHSWCSLPNPVGFFNPMWVKI